MAEPTTLTTPAQRRSLLKLALTLGVAGFGGGMALVGIARHRLVDRDRWLDDQTFLRDLAIAQAIPGTIAANLATLLGLRAAGWRGALAGLALLVLPSAILMGILGALYSSARQLGPIAAIFAGLGPAVVAITLSVGLSFLRRIHRPWQLALALAAAATVALHLLTVFEVVLLTIAGALAFSHFPRRRAALHATSLPILAWVFVQISLSMFGGGLAMIAAVEHQLVAERGWLTATEFSDGVALSQITPGPLATASTFFGYRIAGVPGALVATLAIFLPALLLVFVAAGFLRRQGDRPDVKRTLEALSAATLGLILASAVSLARSGGIAPTWPHNAIDGAFVAAGTLVLLFGINPLWILGTTVALHAAVGALLGG